MKQEEKKDKIPVTVRFNPEELEKLKKWQAALHVSTQQMTTWAILHFIETIETPDQELADYNLPEYIVALRSILHKPRKVTFQAKL